MIVFSYACRVTGGALTTSDEADEHGYFGLDELPARLSPNQRQRILDAFDAKELVYKRQSGPSTRSFLDSLEGRA